MGPEAELRAPSSTRAKAMACPSADLSEAQPKGEHINLWASCSALVHADEATADCIHQRKKNTSKCLNTESPIMTDAAQASLKI